MVTSKTTLSQFIAQVRGQHRASRGRSPATAGHLARLEKMTEQEWVAHRADLIAHRQAIEPVLRRLAR